MQTDIFRMKDKIIRSFCNNNVINVLKLDSKDSDEEEATRLSERELLIINNDNQRKEDNI